MTALFAAALALIEPLLALIATLVGLGLAGLAVKPIARGLPIEDGLRNRLLHAFRYSHLISFGLLGLVAAIAFGLLWAGAFDISAALTIDRSTR